MHVKNSLYSLLLALVVVSCGSPAQSDGMEELKAQYQKVETVKGNRQSLISVVEKIVEQKSRELKGKQGNNFSWLVFKLNHKIYELRAKIEAKKKAIG